MNVVEVQEITLCQNCQGKAIKNYCLECKRLYKRVHKRGQHANKNDDTPRLSIVPIYSRHYSELSIEARQNIETM